MQSSMQGQLTGEKLLAALQEDVGRMRAAVSERYPRDLQVKQQRLNSLQETLNNGVNTEVGRVDDDGCVRACGYWYQVAFGSSIHSLLQTCSSGCCLLTGPLE
jgi:hypothetical protein